MGIVFNLVDDELLGAEYTIIVMSIVIMFYSLFFLWRGLHYFRESRYFGILMAGYAGKILSKYQVNVASKLATLVINLPAIIIPLISYLAEMSFEDNTSNTLMIIVFSTFYTCRLCLGLYVRGWPINIGDVLAEYVITCFFSYAYAASCCYLYDFSGILNAPFLLAGLVMYSLGVIIFVYHAHRLKSLESMFCTRIAYARGGLFSSVVAPQHLGEVLAALGIVIATSSVVAAAHFLFIFCHMAVLSHLRYHELRDRFGGDFDSRTKKLIPLIW